MKRIKDYPNYKINEEGKVLLENNKIKATTINNKGYERITLSENSNKKSFSIHRLVALHFIPNPNNLRYVNHKDGNKLNNHVNNLEWCNNSSNLKHAYINNLKSAKGEKNSRCKITEIIAKEIKEKANSGKYKLINLAKEYQDYLLLLIDEEAEIKEGNYVYSVLYGIGKIIKDYGGESTKNYRPLTAKFQESEVQQEYGRDGIWQMDVVGEKVAKNNCNKVIAYYPLTKEAKELDLPLLPEFKIEIDVDKLANDNYHIGHVPSNAADAYIQAFKKGYKTAQSKQFSLEDVKKAFIAGLEFIAVDPNRYEEDADNYIQSLSTQQLPKEFIPKYEANISDSPYTSNKYNRALKALKESSKIGCKFKTITNSEGKEEIQGRYVY